MKVSWLQERPEHGRLYLLRGKGGHPSRASESELSADFQERTGLASSVRSLGEDQTHKQICHSSLVHLCRNFLFSFHFWKRYIFAPHGKWKCFPCQRRRWNVCTAEELRACVKLKFFGKSKIYGTFSALSRSPWFVTHAHRPGSQDCCHHEFLSLHTALKALRSPAPFLEKTSNKYVFVNAEE